MAHSTSRTSHRARALLLLAIAGLVLAAASSAAGALPRNDYLFVLRHRAGPFHYVATFRKGNPQSYPAAVAAFGRPTTFKTEFLGGDWTYQPHTAGYCSVTWAGPGVTLKLFSFSGWWPPGEDDPPAPPIEPCSQSALATADFFQLSLFGARWHTATGVRIGGPRPRRCLARNYEVPSSRAWGGESVSLDLCTGGERVVTSIDVTVGGVP